MKVNFKFGVFDKILIIGYPNSGKSTLFEDLVALPEFSQHFKLQTDDYKEYPYVEQLYMIMDELSGCEKWLVEGIQGYRLLRKYAQTEDYDLKPNAILICESEKKTPDPKHDNMCKGLDKIWEDYCDIEKDLPQIFYMTDGKNDNR